MDPGSRWGFCGWHMAGILDTSVSAGADVGGGAAVAFGFYGTDLTEIGAPISGPSAGDVLDATSIVVGMGAYKGFGIGVEVVFSVPQDLELPSYSGIRLTVGVAQGRLSAKVGTGVTFSFAETWQRE